MSYDPLKVKRYMVFGTFIAENEDGSLDNESCDEGQFDDKAEAEALCKKRNGDETESVDMIGDRGKFRYFIHDFDPDPYEGGHN